MFVRCSLIVTFFISQVASAATTADLLSKHSVAELATMEGPATKIAPTEAPALARALWSKYVAEGRANVERAAEHKAQELRFADKRMRYAAFKVGPKPSAGYPLYIALHGGGGAPSYINDSQWEHMKVYYRDSVHAGVYVAPRGVSDTWDLHFQPESYVLYERLIENMILFEDVDPDHVYLLGFSAGGDGVYQVTPRLADRLAAANMSAGHPNGVSLKNLASVPFLLQVGELDGAYNRNRVTAEYGDKLAALAAAAPGAYVHEVNVHAGRPHNFYDNDPSERPQSVLEDPHAWLTDGAHETVKRNTNAVRWLSQYTRNPLPERVVWDLTTRAEREAQSLWQRPGHGEQMYWLDIGTHTAATLGTSEIIATLHTADNAIAVSGAKGYLRVLLNGDMLDLSQPVHLTINGEHLDARVEPTLQRQAATLLTRGDPRYIFEAQVTLIEGPRGWELAP